MACILHVKPKSMMTWNFNNIIFFLILDNKMTKFCNYMSFVTKWVKQYGFNNSIISSRKCPNSNQYTIIKTNHKTLNVFLYIVNHIGVIWVYKQINLFTCIKELELWCLFNKIIKRQALHNQNKRFESNI
jgi:hypothetical protein